MNYHLAPGGPVYPATERGEMKELHLASWEKRFWAWLIDFIVIGAVSGGITAFVNSFGYSLPYFPGFTPDPIIWLGEFGMHSTLLFLYWSVMEGNSGQSIGKMVMNIRVTGRQGEKIGYGAAAIESFGKAFFLVIDCLIGWLAMSGTRLRVFNRLSGTIVITTEYEHPAEVRYIIEEEE